MLKAIRGGGAGGKHEETALKAEMKITIISKCWPVTERAGVSLAATTHAKILYESGHDLQIIGPRNEIVEEKTEATRKDYVKAFGSGALYSPHRVDKESLERKLLEFAPDLVIIEGWQSALTDTSVLIASRLSLATLVISHGVSVHPFTPTLVDWIRSVGWLQYRFTVLPKLIGAASVVTSLSLTASSNRFYDRDLARAAGKHVPVLVNAPFNYSLQKIPRSRRRRQIIVVGYFSRIKNQLEVLHILKALPLDVCVKMIGNRKGKYYEKVVARCAQLGLSERVVFEDDQTCNVANEIRDSLVLLSTSITEVLPLTVLEAMACGTPFVAPPVGAIPTLRGGIIARNRDEAVAGVMSLLSVESMWNEHSNSGRALFDSDFRVERVTSQLSAAVEISRRTVLRVGH